MNKGLGIIWFVGLAEIMLCLFGLFALGDPIIAYVLSPFLCMTAFALAGLTVLTDWEIAR